MLAGRWHLGCVGDHAKQFCRPSSRRDRLCPTAAALVPPTRRRTRRGWRCRCRTSVPPRAGKHPGPGGAAAVAIGTRARQVAAVEAPLEVPGYTWPCFRHERACTANICPSLCATHRRLGNAAAGRRRRQKTHRRALVGRSTSPLLRSIPGAMPAVSSSLSGCPCRPYYATRQAYSAQTRRSHPQQRALIDTSDARPAGFNACWRSACARLGLGDPVLAGALPVRAPTVAADPTGGARVPPGAMHHSLRSFQKATATRA